MKEYFKKYRNIKMIKIKKNLFIIKFIETGLYLVNQINRFNYFIII